MTRNPPSSFNSSVLLRYSKASSMSVIEGASVSSSFEALYCFSNSTNENEMILFCMSGFLSVFLGREEDSPRVVTTNLHKSDLLSNRCMVLSGVDSMHSFMLPADAFSSLFT